MIDDLIIGSGPTAWAAARGVLSRGGSPVIIDFGSHPKIAAPIIKGSSALAVKGDSDKEALFSYPKSHVFATDGRQLPLTSARGGLSKIWGAGILMRSQEELHEWAPIYDEIDVAFRALYDLLPSTGFDDMTSNRFPLPQTQGIAPVSRRYEKFLTSMQSTKADVLFGFPRMAMKTEGSACIRCGSCLTGCPESLFFSAETAFKKMTVDGECRFIEGPVTSIEGGDSFSVVTTPTSKFEARRVYLAAGPIGSPSLLQRSKMVPDFLTVMDSAVFYAGLINLNSSTGDEQEFSSAHASLFSDSFGATDFQAAIYESNDEYAARLASAMPLFQNLLKVPKFLVKRINPIIGFLDSSVSGSLELNHRSGRTWVTRKSNDETRRATLRTMTRIHSALDGTGLKPIRRLVSIPAPGTGYHSGASLPMGGDLVNFNSQLITSPSIFIVDASSLPRIPAGSHTFTAMANAYRVGSKE